MSGLLFITAKDADYKAVNRILIELRDWQYGDPETYDRFVLVSSKERPAFELKDGHFKDAKETKPPVPAMTYDAWAGASIDEVEAFLLKQDRDNVQIEGVDDSLYVIVDTEGLETGTCVVGERPLKPEGEEGCLFEFRRIRVPQDEAYSVWCNMNISNMQFEDFCEEEGGEDGWWKYSNDVPELDGEGKSKKEAFI